MDQRQQALQQIKAIAGKNNLTATDIRKALRISLEDKAEKGTIEAAEVLSYLGGIFVFAGIGVYTTMFWQDLSSFMRIALTFGSGLSCYCLALGLSRNFKYNKATQAFYLISAILQPIGLYVFLNEIFENSGNLHFALLFVSGTMLSQQLMTFWDKRLNLILFMVFWFGMIFTFTLFDYMGIKFDYILMSLGASLFCITHSLNETPYTPLTGFWYFLASVSFLGGAYNWLNETPFDVLFLGLCVFIIYLSTLAKSKSVLFVSTIGLLGYIGHYTMLHFVNSIGWPVSLIIIGASFLALSGFAIRIKEKYM